MPEMVTISELPPAGKLSGYEIMEIVQDGMNKKVMLNTVSQTLSGLVTRRYEFTSSMVWKIKHNLKTTSFIATLADFQGTPIFTSITPISKDEIWIQFTEPEEGSASIIFNVG